MSVDPNLYLKIRDAILNFYQFRKDLTNTNESEVTPHIPKISLRNLIFVFHEYSITVQYFENGILNIVNIDIENKKLSRKSTVFSDAELKLFDNWGFVMDESYEREFGISTDDWFKKS